MIRIVFFATSIFLAVITPAVRAQVQDFSPVTLEMLLSPSPDDWLMFSRTYDNQRFSPLDQINRRNVKDLRLAWVRGMRPGIHEHIPLVYRGVMYVANPGAVIQALDATNGDLIWEYERDLPENIRIRAGKARSIAIYDDLIFYSAADGYVVALAARTGELRWESMVAADIRVASGPRIVEDKVMTAWTCRTREGCLIVAHQAQTGKELWRFYTTPAPGEPGGDSWGNVPVEKRIAAPWGLPGAYDPVRKLVYWGIANPKPHTRMKRHGAPDAIPRSAPADLYSNSTVALDPETGKLVWYYQHLPGDDWDADHTQERILLRTPFTPDSQAVKWINPGISRGQERDIVVSLGEPGGIWALDPSDGEFLWATPFPYDIPEFNISHIDVETGITHINWDLVLERDGERKIMCFHNTKSYWPMAYHPGKNSLYIPFHDQCVDTTANIKAPNGNGPRFGILRPGVDPNAFAGIAKVNMATGQMLRIHTQRFPGNGAMLATAGDLIFWGDMNRRFRAFDGDTGKILWETILGGIIQMSTITYSVKGRQYVAVLTGDGASGTWGPLRVVPELKPPRAHNAIYVFALPEQQLEKDP